MKRLLAAVVVIGVCVGIVLWVVRRSTPVPAAEPLVASSPVPPAVEEARAVRPDPVDTTRPRPHAAETEAAAVMSAPAPGVEAKPDAAMIFRQMIDTLVSPQSSFEQKEGVWKQLRQQGKLDDAIAELERGVKNNPTSPEYPTQLGVAYLLKIPSSTDSRDPAILGLKADQSFDAALKVDPSNWEARFDKAMAMSYWPPQLNKGDEVIQRFNELIQQQEGMTTQPQFAQSYIFLGEQYQRGGNSDAARQTWQRGAELFPNDSGLKSRLAGTP